MIDTLSTVCFVVYAYMGGYACRIFRIYLAICIYAPRGSLDVSIGIYFGFGFGFSWGGFGVSLIIIVSLRLL